MLAVLLLNHMTTKNRLAKKQLTRKSKINLSSIKLGCVENDRCRTCLSTEDLEDIFSSKDNNTKRTNDLNLVTGLKIKHQDGLSQKICKNCSNTVKSALRFRRASRRAEKVLLNAITVEKPRKKYNLLEEKIKKEVKEETYDNFDDIVNDDFQNDASYEPEVETVVEECDNTEVPAKQKRVSIPNQSSYKCPTCSKEFRLKATYKAHLRFHTNYYVCEACGKRCRNNHQLQEHKRARHGLGKIHKCKVCEYSSATKEGLIIHERRHTGERPYVCDHCGATFHRRSNLVQHIAIHLPEKNFQCDMCPKRLKSKKFLQIHKHNAHTGNRYGYLCPVCAHNFEKPNKVKAHVRKVHGVAEGQYGDIVRVLL